MFIIHVKDAASAAKLNKHLDSGHHVFALIYMEGCGPCNAARPEWGKLKRTLGQQYKKNNNLVVADVDKDFAHLIHKIKQPNAFPTIIYISPNKIENFEESSINDKSRNVDCFMNWIDSHVLKPELMSKPEVLSNKSRHTRKRKQSSKFRHMKRRSTHNRRQTRSRKNHLNSNSNQYQY